MIQTILTASTAFFFFLFPFFYTGLTSESYEYNKTILFVVVTILLLILNLVYVAQKRTLTFIQSTYSIPLFLLAVITTVSVIFQSPNPVVAITTPMTAINLIAGFFLYLSLLSGIPMQDTQKYFLPLVLSAAGISLFIIGMHFEIINKSAYTPAGSFLSTTLYLAIISVYLLTSLIVDLKKKPYIAYFFTKSLLFLLISFSTVFTAYRLVTDQKPVILPFRFGWWLLLDILKDPKTFLLGVGPANFVSAFTLAKSPEINATPFWNVVFTSSSSFVLNLGTEIGIIALLLYLILIIQSGLSLVSQIKKRHFDAIPFTITLLFALVVQVLLPSSTTVFILLIVLLAFSTHRTIGNKIPLAPSPILFISIFPIIATLLGVLYFTGRFYFAEIAFKKSLNAFVNNQAGETYNNQKEAIVLNPWIDRYHVAFSSTSIALANALAGKKDITQEDKENIPKLTQQAIEEAKLATRLYPTNIANWDNLFRLYASLINFAQGADQWAIETATQRISLDPVNPQARLNVGGLYLNLKKYNEAEKLFRDAITLKPDFTNGYYNLAVVLREEKKFDASYQAYQSALNLIEKGSENEKKIQEEIKLLPLESTESSQLKEGTFSGILR